MPDQHKRQKTPPSTEKRIHRLGVGEVDGQADTGHDHHPRTDHLDVARGSSQEVDHDLPAHAHKHGDGDHQNEQTDHQASNAESNGGRAERAEEDDERQHGGGGAVNGRCGVADAVEVHVASWREGVVGLGGAVLVNEVLNEAHDMRRDAKEHHRAKHDEEQSNEDGNVVDDAGTGERSTHQQGHDADETEERPHTEPREHTDVERTWHADLEFPLSDEFVFSRPE